MKTNNADPYTIYVKLVMLATSIHHGFYGVICLVCTTREVVRGVRTSSISPMTRFCSLEIREDPGMRLKLCARLGPEDESAKFPSLESMDMCFKSDARPCDWWNVLLNQNNIHIFQGYSQTASLRDAEKQHRQYTE